jgi:GNAT superfamily N-acetyltransferase
VHADPDHRDRGIARRLTEVAIDWARVQWFNNFVLHAGEQGRPIYERLAFANPGEWVLPLR